MSDFNLFRESVISLYTQKKLQNELHDKLANPSPANLRDYTMKRLSEGLPDTDMVIIKDFYDPTNKYERLEKAIEQYPTGRLKALQNFILGTTKEPDTLLVKLLAILVDYQHRPYRFVYGAKDTGSSDSSTLTSEQRQSDVNSGDSILNKGENNKEMVVHHQMAEQENQDSERVKTSISQPLYTISLQNDNTYSNKTGTSANINPQSSISSILITLWRNRYVLRFSAGVTLITVLFITIYKLTPKQCMYWTGDHYEAIDCNDKNQYNQIIALNDRIETFKKITRPDTLSSKDTYRVWYSKIDHEVEFFTGSGYHPIHTDRSLKAATTYILEKYAGKNWSKRLSLE